MSAGGPACSFPAASPRAASSIRGTSATRAGLQLPPVPSMWPVTAKGGGDQRSRGLWCEDTGPPPRSRCWGGSASTRLGTGLCAPLGGLLRAAAPAPPTRPPARALGRPRPASPCPLCAALGCSSSSSSSAAVLSSQSPAARTGPDRQPQVHAGPVAVGSGEPCADHGAAQDRGPADLRDQAGTGGAQVARVSGLSGRQGGASSRGAASAPRPFLPGSSQQLSSTSVAS